MAEGITGKMKDFFGLGSVDSYEDPYHYDEFDDDRDDRDRRDHRDRCKPNYRCLCRKSNFNDQ
jgi:cell division inhibitor SepF